MKQKPKGLRTPKNALTTAVEQTRLQEAYLEQMELAKQSELTVNDHLRNAQKNVGDLAALGAELTASLSLVTGFAPFFDLNVIRQENVTDMSRLDQQYMLSIGQQLIADYRVFHGQAQNLSTRIKEIHTELTANASNPSIDLLSDIGARATQLHSEYVEWTDRYTRIIVKAMEDIANHLNPLRPADRQIRVAF